MSDFVRRARRYWWHGGGVVCIIFLLLLANRFGAYVPDVGDGEQANSPVDLTHRCSFNASLQVIQRAKAYGS
jgi:hypothetical protein